jgi:FkbM family methyltransferase
MQLGIVESNISRQRLSKETQISFSQFGEDLVIWAALESRGQLNNGFYVDVGAFDPFRFSNTALLHMLRGWQGVNIDANEATIAAFNQQRPNDTNIHCPVSDVEEDVTFYEYSHGAVNTIDPRMVDRHARTANTPFKVRRAIATRTRRLDNIMRDIPNVPKNFGLLSIDCEGVDHRVLLSMDWDRFRPHLVAIECHGFGVTSLSKDPSYTFLTARGYRLISHVFVTSIYANP